VLIILIVLGCVALGLGVGFSASGGPSATAVAAGSSNVASTPGWQAVGQQATQWQQQNQSTPGPDGAAPPQAFPATETVPVDISGPGTFTLTGGPVSPGADIAAASVSFPGDTKAHFDMSAFAMKAGTNPVLIQKGGATYVQVTINVESVVAPYTSFTVWVL
jgi:hypothetical protein